MTVSRLRFDPVSEPSELSISNFKKTVEHERSEYSTVNDQFTNRRRFPVEHSTLLSAKTSAFEQLTQDLVAASKTCDLARHDSCDEVGVVGIKSQVLVEVLSFLERVSQVRH